MAAIRMDGKALAAKVKEQTRQEAAALARRPGLAVILVGDDPASRVYVNSKRKDCEECGFYSEEYALLATTSQEELLGLIGVLNEREDIDGILVQLPLPAGFNEEEVLLAIDPGKDVDCFHPYNVGKLTIGQPVFQPCTPGGIMEMLREYHIDPAGKRCVVQGHRLAHDVGPAQHRGQAYGPAAAPRRRHGGHVPLQDPRHEGPGGQRGYPGVRRGQGGPGHRRHGEGGGGGHRRGHEPRRGRQAVRRRLL